LLILRKPSVILGSSEGLTCTRFHQLEASAKQAPSRTGSTAILTVARVSNFKLRKVCASSLWLTLVMVAVLTMEASMPWISTQLPAGTRFTSMR